MDTFGAYSSDDERTLRFPYKTPEPFDRNKIYSTWLFANCRDQKGLDDMWRVGIPAKHLESSIEEVYVGDEDGDVLHNSSLIMYVQLGWAMSVNELDKCFDGWTEDVWGEQMPIGRPCMRPAKNDYKTEKQYTERAVVWNTQWHDQYPASFKYSEEKMPTKPKGKQVAKKPKGKQVAKKPKGKQVAKKPPVVTKAPVVAKAMVVTAPQVVTLVATKQAASNALEVIAPAAKRPCPSDNLQDTTPEGKLLTALKVPMSAESVAKTFSLPGKKQANQLLYPLNIAGKIKLVSGWGVSPGAVGTPMWQVV